MHSSYAAASTCAFNAPLMTTAVDRVTEYFRRKNSSTATRHWSRIYCPDYRVFMYRSILVHMLVLQSVEQVSTLCKLLYVLAFI